MKWKKLGVVWKPNDNLWWAQKYATCPTPIFLQDGSLRMYIQCRDAYGIGRVGYVDLDPTNPLRIVNVSKEPILDIGLHGTFDDNGILQTSVVKISDEQFLMYYVGFELCHHVRYRLLTGLAVSHDGGNTFKRIKSTPILERSSTEICVRGGPFVQFSSKSKYKMWYVAGSVWEEIEGKSMPVYDIRYVESPDGINWPESGSVVLQLNRNEEHGFGRPYIVKKQNLYQMFYSIRKKSPRAYRLGYAESKDGIHWDRKDDELGLDVSSNGWDSESIEYSAVIDVNDKTLCFYNGNDFGATGFGVAELIK